MAAPIANMNAVRHGLSSGKLPQGAAYIARLTHELRRSIEDAVIALKGEVSLIDAATIQTAMRWERHALLAQRWLRHEAKQLDPQTRLAFSRDVARASESRDRALKALGLDRTTTQNVIDSLYSNTETTENE